MKPWVLGRRVVGRVVARVVGSAVGRAMARHEARPGVSSRWSSKGGSVIACNGHGAAQGWAQQGRTRPRQGQSIGS